MAEPVSVNREMLCDEIAQMTGIAKTDVNQVVGALIYDTQLHVKKGDRVGLVGFGTFERQLRGPRTARNPRTGEPVKVKATKAPRFRPGATFKQIVAGAKLERPSSLKPPARTAKTTGSGKATAARAGGTRARAGATPRASAGRRASSTGRRSAK